MSCSEWYKLEELLKIKYGKNQKKIQDNENGIYPIYGTGGLMGYSKEYLYNKPSILIGRKGSISRVKYVEHPFWTVDTLFYTEINENLVIPKYLYYKMSMIDFNFYNEGTTIPSLRTDTLNKIEFQIHSLEEQEKIVNILSSLDDKIELNNEINKTLEEMAQSIFKRWFVDFEFPNEDGQPYKSSGGEMVESELGMIPKGWEVKELGKCVTFSQGIQVPVKKQVQFYEDGLKRFLRIVDYTSNDSEEPRYVEDKGDRYYCTRREVAMVRYGNSSGFICRRLEGILANNLFKINPCYPLGYNYIYYLLSMDSIQEYITSAAVGSAMPALNHSIIANIKFVAPNEDIINMFEDISSQIEEKICSNRENNKIISSLRDTLLPKLMSGNIKLNI